MTPEEKERNYKLAEELLSEQNYGVAVIAGIVATILAAGIYGVIAALAGYSVGFLALGVGAFIGFTIQYLGRGIESKFVVLAAVLAVIGCLLGEIFAAIIIDARLYGESPLRIASQMTLDGLIEFFVDNFQLADLAFWALAIYGAIFLAKRPLSREEGLAIYTWEARPKEQQFISK